MYCIETQQQHHYQQEAMRSSRAVGHQQQLARSPIHQQPSKMPSLQQNHDHQDGGEDDDDDAGISSEELQRSYKNHLTQPATNIAATKKVVAETNPATKSQCLSSEGSSRTGLNGTVSIFRFQLDGVKMLKMYLQHLGIALVTALVVVLACSLRGRLVGWLLGSS